MLINHRVPIKIIAHRGNSAHAPENSKSAFDEALRLGVDFLECDVQLSKDGIPLVMHDGCFTRITRRLSVHKVDSLDYEDIKNIDSGTWFDEKYSSEKILTLRRFLELYREESGMMIDVKDETVKERYLASHVAEVIKDFAHEHPHHGPILVGSLNPNVLYCFEGFLPEQQLIPIVKYNHHFAEFAPIPARYYAIFYPLATKKRIAELHEKGIEVWAWVVDDKKIAKKLIANGIDGLITNMPKKMLHYRNSHAPHPRKHAFNNF